MIQALPTLSAAGESQTLEFKASFDKACIATLVAFANAQEYSAVQFDVREFQGGLMATFAQKQPESQNEGANGGTSKQLEQALCDYLGVKYISLLTTGTIALVMAHSLQMNGITPVFGIAPCQCL